MFVFLQYKAGLTIDHFNEALADSSKATVGYKKRSKAECISANVQKTAEEREQQKKKLLGFKSLKLKDSAAAHYRENDTDLNVYKTRQRTVHSKTCRRSRDGFWSDRHQDR